MVSSRERLALRPPPEDPKALQGFPKVVDRPKVLFRLARRDRHPWWFSSSLEGRFDLPAPAGTCYLACDAVAALFEVLGPSRTIGIVTAEFLASRKLARLPLLEDRTLADLTARSAAAFGITLEIGTVTPYKQSQAWAARLVEAGFGGLVGFLRHDPAASRGVALFGSGGEWSDGPVLGFEPLVPVARQAGLTVAPIPRLVELEIVEQGRLPQRPVRKRS